jgi:hypothetical protein
VQIENDYRRQAEPSKRELQEGNEHDTYVETRPAFFSGGNRRLGRPEVVPVTHEIRRDLVERITKSADPDIERPPSIPANVRHEAHDGSTSSFAGSIRSSSDRKPVAVSYTRGLSSRRRNRSHSSERALQGRSRDAAPTKDPAPTFNIVPFLTWRLTPETDDRTPEEVDVSLVKILSRLNNWVLKEVTSKVYSRAYTCTMDDLLQRHELLLPLTGKDDPMLSPVNENDERSLNGLPHDATGEPADTTATVTESRQPENNANSSTVGPDANAQANDEGENSSQSNSNAPRTKLRRDSTNSDIVETVEHELELMKQLLKVSQSIFWAFVPKQGSPLIHRVSVKFWGAVDSICRVSYRLCR